MSKIPFFKFFTKSKFSVSDVNKYFVGVGTPTYIKNFDVCIWKKSIKDSPCHPELVSGSSHRQKCATICTVSGKEVLDKVGWAFSPTLKCCWGGGQIKKPQPTENFNAQRRVAFTLAEVLITLGIIGVVAAMTLPTLIANYQKQETISKLQKVYTILNQALKLSEVDNGEFEYWDVDHSDPEAYFEKYWKPYLKIAKMCNTYQECGYTAIDPLTFANGNHSTTSIVNHMRTTFYLPDGVLLAISLQSGGGTSEDGSPIPVSDNLGIFIDLNGANRPNQYGKDFFVATLTKKGVLPSGYNLSYDEVTENCSKTGSGSHCMSKLIRDGWKIKDDYPW